MGRQKEKYRESYYYIKGLYLVYKGCGAGSGESQDKYIYKSKGSKVEKRLVYYRPYLY